MFFIPNKEKIVNLIFKLPDLLSNYFEKDFINRSDFFNEIIYILFYQKLFDCIIIDKISRLKLIKKLLNNIKKYPEQNISNTNSYQLEILQFFENSIYYEDFLENLFKIHISDVSEFKTILIYYSNLNITTKIYPEDIIEIINYNDNFISLVFKSYNKSIINNFIKSLLNLLTFQKDTINNINSYEFFLITLSFYLFLEAIKDENQILDILNKIFQMIGNILQNLLDENKKKICSLFSKYIKDKILFIIGDKESLASNSDDPIAIELELTDQEKQILNFQKIKEELERDELYLEKLKQKYEPTATLNYNKKLIYEKNVKKEKTKYKSIKFQKKYGQYDNSVKTQNPFLEFEEKEIKINLPENNKINPLRSILKIKLDSVHDEDYSDLNLLSTPMYIKDLLLGFGSEFKDRVEMSLNCLPGMVESEPLDLNLFLVDLSEIVLKLNNSWDIDNFDQKIEQCLISLTVYNPVQMTQNLCKRFFLEECGMKQKFQILNTIEKSCELIANKNIIKSNLPHQNKLHIFIEYIIFPLLNYLHLKNIAFLLIIPEFDFLLVKFLMVIAKLIKLTDNHPYIYKILIESFDLFKSVCNYTKQNEKTILLLDSLNYYCSIISKFFNKTFLEIYPEFFTNFKFILNFLNENLLLITNEELKYEIMKNINNYIVNLNKLKQNLEINYENQAESKINNFFII